MSINNAWFVDCPTFKETRLKSMLEIASNLEFTNYSLGLLAGQEWIADPNVDGSWSGEVPITGAEFSYHFWRGLLDYRITSLCIKNEKEKTGKTTYKTAGGPHLKLSATPLMLDRFATWIEWGDEASRVALKIRDRIQDYEGPENGLIPMEFGIADTREICNLLYVGDEGKGACIGKYLTLVPAVMAWVSDAELKIEAEAEAEAKRNSWMFPNAAKTTE